MNATEYWHNLYQSQTDWAFRAYDRLVSHLSLDIQDKLKLGIGSKNESYVVIFGKTQVGKTTLLLDLLGIKLEYMSEVSNVLRGKRKMGTSATATAMEYCCSIDNQWGLSWGQEDIEWFSSGAMVREKLAEIRFAMEQGKQLPPFSCVIHLPKKFFKNNSAFSVRILDLPGDNPANKSEQDHVNKMAKKYLPFADLVLLVGKSDDLSFLKSDAITLPGIEDWQLMPNKFRIVTTYSYSTQSIQEFLSKESNCNQEVIRKRLIEQIQRFGSLADNAQHHSLYFPLEFGNSWENMAITNPELHSRLREIIEAFKSDLLEQIMASTTPLGRFRNTWKTHESIEFISKQKIVHTKNHIKELEKKIVIFDDEIDKWEQTLRGLENRLQEIHSQLEDEILIDPNRYINQIARMESYHSEPKIDEKAKQETVTLIKLVQGYKIFLKSLKLNVLTIDNKILRKAQEYFKEPNLKALIDEILDEEFEEVLYKLNDYWIETYIFSDNYKADKAEIQSVVEKAYKRLEYMWKNAWVEALSDIKQNFNQNLKDKQQEIQSSWVEYEVLLKHKKKLNNLINQQKNSLKKIQENCQEDVRRCQQFKDYIHEEYCRELSDRKNRIISEKDDCKSLLQLFSCFELKQQYSDLVNFK